MHCGISIVVFFTLTYAFWIWVQKAQVPFLVFAQFKPMQRTTFSCTSTMEIDVWCTFNHTHRISISTWLQHTSLFLSWVKKQFLFHCYDITSLYLCFNYNLCYYCNKKSTYLYILLRITQEKNSNLNLQTCLNKIFLEH